MSAVPKRDSPCIDVCTLDPASGHCVGCFRTIDEIAGWGSYSDAERAAVRLRLGPRRARFEDRLMGAVRRAPQAANSRCARCGTAFSCGAGDASTPCWCVSYPPVAPAKDAALGCLCPQCLAAAAK